MQWEGGGGGGGGACIRRGACHSQGRRWRLRCWRRSRRSRCWHDDDVGVLKGSSVQWRQGSMYGQRAACTGQKTLHECTSRSARMCNKCSTSNNEPSEGRHLNIFTLEIRYGQEHTKVHSTCPLPRKWLTLHGARSAPRWRGASVLACSGCVSILRSLCISSAAVAV